MQKFNLKTRDGVSRPLPTLADYIDTTQSSKSVPTELRGVISKLLMVREEDFQHIEITDRLVKEVTNNDGTTSKTVIVSLSSNGANDYVRGIKGTIIDVTNGRVLSTSYPNTLDIEVKPDTTINLDPTGSIITKAYEGTICRLTYIVDRWYLSTHNSIDGQHKRWCGPTFGEMFKDVWDQSKLSYDDLLCRDTTYLFLLSHPANRLVCKIDTPKLYYLASYTQNSDGTLKFDRERKGFKDVKLTPPGVCYAPRYGTNKIQSVVELLNNSTWEECTGILLFNPDTSECVKLMRPDYASLKNIRGNEPNVMYQYLELRNVRGMSKEDVLNEQWGLAMLYPHLYDEFLTLETYYQKLPQYLSNMWKVRFRAQKFLFLCKEVHIFISSLGSSNLDEIREKLQFTKSRYVYNMIQYMISKS
jgi:hypothetical protein